ncbi:hypothetical protein ACNKHW_13410 [Shigella flexneri]
MPEFTAMTVYHATSTNHRDNVLHTVNSQADSSRVSEWLCYATVFQSIAFAGDAQQFGATFCFFNSSTRYARQNGITSSTCNVSSIRRHGATLSRGEVMLQGWVLKIGQCPGTTIRRKASGDFAAGIVIHPNSIFVVDKPWLDSFPERSMEKYFLNIFPFGI